MGNKPDLFGFCFSHQLRRFYANKRSISYKKYSPEKRDERYHNSGGSKKAKEIEVTGSEYYLYVAAYIKT